MPTQEQLEAIETLVIEISEFGDLTGYVKQGVQIVLDYVADLESKLAAAQQWQPVEDEVISCIDAEGSRVDLQVKSKRITIDEAGCYVVALLPFDVHVCRRVKVVTK